MFNGLEDAKAALDAGKTLPAHWYGDLEVHERELQRIFAREWQYVGHASRLTEPGDHIAAMAGHVPVVVVRDGGSLCAFVNVCPHRAHPVVLGSGRRSTLQCGYHGWTFGLDGCLRAAPRSDREPAFDADSVRLRPVQVDSWGPLVFVNPDLEAGPLADALAGLPGLASERGLDLDSLPLRARREHVIDANWKITLDNNTECYHCATVHPSFRAAYHVDRDHYQVTGFERAFSHRSPARSGERAAPDFHLYYLWPNFMLSARGSDHFYIYVYLPLGPTQTMQVNEYFYPDSYTGDDLKHELADLDQLMKEDWDVHERVQVGLRSGMIPHGQLLEQEEKLLRHFQRRCLEALAP